MENKEVHTAANGNWHSATYKPTYTVTKVSLQKKMKEVF